MRRAVNFYHKNFKKLLLLQIVVCAVLFIFLSCVPKNEREVRFDAGSMAGGFISEEGYACIDESDGIYGLILDTTTGEIKRGWYKIRVEYETGYNDNGFIVQALRPGNVLNEDIGNEERAVALKAHQNSREVHAWLKKDSDLRIAVHFCGGGYLQIRRIVLWRVPDYTPVFLLMLCLLLLNIELYEAGRFPEGEVKRRRYVRGGIACIVLLASIPFWNGFVMGGDDFKFHMFRIEGIAEGLRSGQFPVKIMPNWWNEFGYGVSLFYGDLFLYMPAVLTLLGYSIQTAYKCYIVGINLLTAGIAYKCFFKIAKNEKTALLGTFLYSLNLYRLIDIYIRCAVGEYTAIAFLPLIFVGIYFMEEDGWAYLALGLSGCIQSHVLTSMMAMFFVALFCVFKIKWVLKKGVFLRFCKAAAAVVLWNAWYIVPFLNVYTGQKYRIHFSELGIDLEERGLPFSALFQVGYDEYYTIGLTLILAGILALVVLFGRGKTADKGKDKSLKGFGGICLGMMALSIVLSLNSMPYSKIGARSLVIKKLTDMIQFPWRFMEFAAVFAVTALVAAYALGKGSMDGTAGKPKRILKYAAAVLVILMAVGLPSVYEALLPEGKVASHEYYAMEGFMEGTEYLPADAREDEVSHELIRSSEDIVIENYEKEYSSILMDCENEGTEEGFVDLPLFYYPCYKAADVETKEILPLAYGENKRIRVMLPPGYQGRIALKVSERKLWRLAEAVSIFSILAALCMGMKRNAAGARHKDNCDEEVG